MKGPTDLRKILVIIFVVSGAMAVPPANVGQRGDATDLWLNGRNSRSISYYLGNIAKLLIGGNVGPGHPLVKNRSNSSTAVVAPAAPSTNVTTNVQQPSGSQNVQNLVPQSQSLWGTGGQGQNSPYFGTQSYVNPYTNYHQNYPPQQQQQVSASSSVYHHHHHQHQHQGQQQQPIGQAPKNIFVTFQTTPSPPPLPPPPTTSQPQPQPQPQQFVYHQPISVPLVHHQQPQQFSPYIIPANVYSPAISVPTSPITAQTLTTYTYQTPPPVPALATYFQIQTTVPPPPPPSSQAVAEAEGHSLMRSSTVDGEIQGSPAKYIGSFMGQDEPYPMGGSRNVHYDQSNGQLAQNGRGQLAQSINYEGATHYYPPKTYQGRQQEPQAAASSYQAPTQVVHFHQQNQQPQVAFSNHANNYQFNQGGSNFNQFNQGPPPNPHQVSSQWSQNLNVQPPPHSSSQQNQFRPPPPLPSPPPPQTATPQEDGKIKTTAVRQAAPGHGPGPTSGKANVNGMGPIANTLNSISNYFSKFKYQVSSNRRIDNDNAQYDDSMRMDPVNLGQNYPPIQHQQPFQQTPVTETMSLPLTVTAERQDVVPNFVGQNLPMRKENNQMIVNEGQNFLQNYHNYIDSFRALQIPMENESPVEFYDEAPINNEGLPSRSGHVTPAVAIYHASYMSY